MCQQCQNRQTTYALNTSNILGKKIIKILGLSFEAISSNSKKAAAVLHSGIRLLRGCQTLVLIYTLSKFLALNTWVLWIFLPVLFIALDFTVVCTVAIDCYDTPEMLILVFIEFRENQE